MIEVLTSGLDDYLRDESNLAGGRATEVALPVSPEEAAEFVRHCAENKTKLTISGARTGIVGGAVLCTERMNTIKEFGYEAETDIWWVKLEPGVLLADLQQCVQSKMAPGAILEIELELVVEPETWFGGLAFFPGEAEAVQFVRRVRDERSEILTICRPSALEYFDQASLQLFNRSGQRRKLQFPEIPGNARAAIFFEQGCRESELEMVYEAWENGLRNCGSSNDDVWSATESKDNQKLKRMRHLVPEAVNRIVAGNRRRCPAVHKVGTDLAVPDSYLDDLVKVYRGRLVEEQIPAVVFGHIGNNNLHVNMLPTDETSLKKAKLLHLEWAKWAVERGGTVIAEHGIGKIKGELLKLLYMETELAEMRAIKRALDPRGILGPGNGIVHHYEEIC